MSDTPACVDGFASYLPGFASSLGRSDQDAYPIAKAVFRAAYMLTYPDTPEDAWLTGCLVSL